MSRSGESAKVKQGTAGPSLNTAGGGTDPAFGPPRPSPAIEDSPGEPVDQPTSAPEPIATPGQEHAVTAVPGAEQAPREQPLGEQHVPNQDEPAVFFQELDIQRQPKLSMLGTVIAQDLHYRIWSELHVEPPDENGSREVRQVVRDTQLVKADALSQGLFAESLKRLIGRRFSYSLDSRNEVIQFRGPGGDKTVEPVQPAGAEGFLVTSIMDEDGWKELAELSFFVPDRGGVQNRSWTRAIDHDYQPLGSWSGETTFVSRGEERNVLRVDYAHRLTYKPPANGAAAGGLPFTVNGADLEAITAGGVILFDTRLGRVLSAREQFHVRGTLSAVALGQLVNIRVEERQLITVRIFDQAPANHER